MREFNLSEKEVRTCIAVFEELQKKPYDKLNTFLGSLTIKEMNLLQMKLRVWYNHLDEDEWFDEWSDDYYDDGYSSNCACDTTGFCGGPSCPQYYKCNA